MKKAKLLSWVCIISSVFSIIIPFLIVFKLYLLAIFMIFLSILPICFNYNSYFNLKDSSDNKFNKDFLFYNNSYKVYRIVFKVVFLIVTIMIVCQHLIP